MATPVNPYVAGNPVGDSPAFVGRADVLREVTRVLRRSQDNAIVLYGQRRIGKTSILQHLAAQLSFGGPYRPVYFDLQDKAAWPLGRVLQELARSIAHSLGQPDPDLGPDPETAFRDEWLPAVLGDLPEGSSLVLLFDEFDVLADPKAEQAAATFFPYLRDLLALAPQRLQFVFVIGRNVDDLDNIALSLFKGTRPERVSLLSREDTADLVHLSEVNDTLRWSPYTVERVWQLTHGHPFLTQQLCSHVWERAYDEEPGAPPTVTRTDVEAAVSDALEASGHAMEWLWDGLPPAERVVASALAEAGPGPITQNELEQLLHESGVRVVIRELQNAPQLLQDWDLIEPADGGYRFRVELLRRWISEHKPLHRVQQELDHIEPVAENLYQAALGLYQGGQLDQAMALLRQAIALNPNHVRANQLLADILLAQGQTGEARQLLERLYEYQPAAARPRLVQTLLGQAQATEDDVKQLQLYKRILQIEPKQPEAAAARYRLIQTWLARAQTTKNDVERLQLYERVLKIEPGQLEAIKGCQDIRRHYRGLETALLPLWSPLSYLRLFWWIVARADVFWLYRYWADADGERRLERLGSWVASTFIWLPLFIPTLIRGGRGTSMAAEMIGSPNIYSWMIAGLALAWALTGWSGNHDDKSLFRVVRIVAFSAAFVVTFIVIFDSVSVIDRFIIESNMMARMIVGLTAALFVGLGLGPAFSVAFGVTEFIVGSKIPRIVAFGMIFGAVIGMPFGAVVTMGGGWVGALIGIVAALFTTYTASISAYPLFGAGILPNLVEESLKTGHPWVGRVAFFGALLVYLLFSVTPLSW